MASNVYTGANFILAYLEQETDSSGNVTANNLHPVGVGVKLGTFETNYNVEGAYGIGDRIIDVMYSKGFEGSLSFDMILSDSNSMFASKWLSSNSIKYADLYIVELNGDVLSTDVKNISSVIHIANFKADSIKITARAGEYIGISVDGKYTYMEQETLSPEGDLIVEDLIETPLIFASAALSVPSGTWGISIDITKEFEIDVRQNIEVLRVLNDLYPAVLQEQKFGVEATLNVYVDSGTWNELMTNLAQGKHYKTDMYPAVNLELTVTGNNNTYTFTLSDVALNTFSTSFEDANVVEGSLKLIGKNLTYANTANSS